MMVSRNRLLTTICLIPVVALAGCGGAPAQRTVAGKLIQVGVDLDEKALRALVTRTGIPVVVIGSVAYQPEKVCVGERRLGGATEARGLGGATESRGLGGATETRGLGGATEDRALGGATEDRGLGGATESRGLGGATEDRGLGGATEDRGLGGATESRGLGGATEDRGLGGATEARGLGGATESRGVGGAVSGLACLQTQFGFAVLLDVPRQMRFHDGERFIDSGNEFSY